MLFAVLILLWLTRDPRIICGWACLFPADYETDGASAMLIATLLFILPRHPPCFMCFCPRAGVTNGNMSLLQWADVQRRLSWGTVLLLGGGYALADGVTVGIRSH